MIKTSAAGKTRRCSYSLELLFLLFVNFFDHIQKHFVFLGALMANIQVLADHRHDVGGVLAPDLTFHILVQFGVDLLAGEFLFVLSCSNTRRKPRTASFGSSS